MTTAESVLIKGLQLYELICRESADRLLKGQSQQRLVLSFDLYCTLIEYAALLGRLNTVEGHSVEEYFEYDDLVFDTGNDKLLIRIDFFSDRNVLSIA